jgi:hypothetical protein
MSIDSFSKIERLMDATLYRSLLAIDPRTNYPISTNYIISTDGFGDIVWQNSLSNIYSTDNNVGYLPSTINSLSTQMYNLEAGFLSGSLNTLNLVSTVNGLGSIGYVSSASLISSVIGVNNNLVSSITDILNNKQNIYLNTAGALVIGGSNINVTISTISSFYFYNTFYNSSINYKGNNNNAIAFNSGLDFYVSTLDTQLDRFSSFITNKTNISLEVYPNIIFPQINTNSNPQIYHVSSFIQYNGSNIGSASASAIQQTKFLAMNNSASNLFQQSLRINVPGSLINNNYSYPYLLNHRFINAYASNTNVGFSSSNVKIYMDSTSSYYLSIQNIAP